MSSSSDMMVDPDVDLASKGGDSRVNSSAVLCHESLLGQQLQEIQRGHWRMAHCLSAIEI